MSKSSSEAATSHGSLFETARMVLQCPIFHSREEGIIMDVVQYLIEAKRDKHALWGHFHSAPWLPSFFTSYPETDSHASLTGQGLVVFTIDCRTIEHARSLLKGLRAHLLLGFQEPVLGVVDIGQLVLERVFGGLDRSHGNGLLCSGV